jgi:glutamyl-tRNA synthetase
LNPLSIGNYAIVLTTKNYISLFMNIKTRFAPSPTGYLHVGGARTALFSWIYAKKTNGKFVLRVEDTDLVRSTPEAVQAILDGMEWLGLHEDEGPFYQTDRFERYKEIIQKMLEGGHAYRCYCSKERLDNLRTEQMKNKLKPKYDGCCRSISSEKKQSFVVRFKNPLSGSVSWKDLVKGDINIANSELDDFIIARSDGTPTYNFCVVIDDIDMAITHVVRGDDHVNNTPKQINLYHALGVQLPLFAHVPMINGTDGKKLSKRHGAVSVMQYRDDGYLPQALVNYLIRLGWSHGDQEVFSEDELLEFFELKDINASPAAFDFDKLNWLNQHYMRSLPVKEVASYLQWQFNQLNINTNNGPSLDSLIPVMAEKFKTLKEIAEQSIYFYENFNSYVDAAKKKHLKKAAKAPLMEVLGVLQLLSNNDWYNDEKLHTVLTETAAKLEIGMGKVGMPVRVAITGGSNSPDIGTTMRLIGKERVLERIAIAIKTIDMD